MIPKMEIYLDNAATSMIDPRVLEAMLSCQHMKAMNASSAHKLGVVAATAIEKARAVIALSGSANIFRRFVVAVSRRTTAPSHRPSASEPPSGEKASAVT